MINSAPGLPRDSEGMIVGFNDDGKYYSNEPGHVGYYERIIRNDNLEYIWNPSPYDFESAAFKNPDITNLANPYNWRGITNPGEKYADPEYIQQIYELKQTNPTAYYNQLAQDLADQSSANSSMNKGEHNVGFTNQLNQIKEIDPAAYYKAQFDILGESIGWQIGQNTSYRNEGTFKKIQELAPEAIKAGLTPDEINSIVNKNANYGNITNQQRIANEAASGGSGFNLGELVRGIAPIAALAIGAPFLDVALAGGAAGAGALETAGAAGLTGGGAFVPAAGSGASFSIIPGATYTTAGLSQGALSTADILGSTGFTPTAGSSFAIDPTVAYTTAGSYVTPELMGPTYQELGYTGLEAGQMGPTYAELGYTGLNQSEAIAAADAAAKAAGSSLLSNAGDLLKGAQLTKGLLGGTQQPQQQPQTQAPKSIIPRGQVDYSGILNLLQTPSPQRNPYSLLG